MQPVVPKNQKGVMAAQATGVAEEEAPMQLLLNQLPAMPVPRPALEEEAPQA